MKYPLFSLDCISLLTVSTAKFKDGWRFTIWLRLILSTSFVRKRWSFQEGLICSVIPRPKKGSLVSGNRPGENFLSLTLLHSRMYIRIYFDFKKQTKKGKETKEKEKTIFGKSIKIFSSSAFRETRFVFLALPNQDLY